MFILLLVFVRMFSFFAVFVVFSRVFAFLGRVLV